MSTGSDVVVLEKSQSEWDVRRFTKRFSGILERATSTEQCRSWQQNSVEKRQRCASEFTRTSRPDHAAEPFGSDYHRNLCEDSGFVPFTEVWKSVFFR
jgi:hypothetical protein